MGLFDALVERMFTPGAATSIFSPQLENEALASFQLEAATVIASSAEAGEKSKASVSLLPAATTTTIPLSCSYFMASSMATVLQSHPQLLEETLAPMSAAY